MPLLGKYLLLPRAYIGCKGISSPLSLLGANIAPCALLLNHPKALPIPKTEEPFLHSRGRVVLLYDFAIITSLAGVTAPKHPSVAQKFAANCAFWSCALYHLSSPSSLNLAPVNQCHTSCACSDFSLHITMAIRRSGQTIFYTLRIAAIHAHYEEIGRLIAANGRRHEGDVLTIRAHNAAPAMTRRSGNVFSCLLRGGIH